MGPWITLATTLSFTIEIHVHVGLGYIFKKVS